VFVFLNAGVPTLVTGPVWSNVGAGTGARGTGVGTTELARINGVLCNAVAMPTARNGASTFSVGANMGTYLGSIWIDGVAGQVTCHRTWGPSRKWGISNAFNRQPLFLKAGDATASWTYQTNTIRPSRGDSANSLTVFSGLAEEWFDLHFGQRVELLHLNNLFLAVHNGIGWNSTVAMSGRRGRAGLANGTGGMTYQIFFNVIAEFQQVPALGINVVTALETATQTDGTATWFGGEDDMVLSAKWRG
jgi:hypothetical protein